MVHCKLYNKGRESSKIFDTLMTLFDDSEFSLVILGNCNQSWQPICSPLALITLQRPVHLSSIYFFLEARGQLI